MELFSIQNGEIVRSTHGFRLQPDPLTVIKWLRTGSVFCNGGLAFAYACSSNAARDPPMFLVCGERAVCFLKR